MTEEIELLNNVMEIDPTLVILANGSVTYAVKRGTIELNPKLILLNVLYVPSLNCNLVSVAQLLDEIF